ncbi:MAG: Glyoxalase/bleomycin resistance protein/dioxygenase [Ilumatobacteraceae bacterium]|nr:Glyoxalase/bleomycin resistance protein/dioxygenase [Ilumatobacteraceae bacterium]
MPTRDSAPVGAPCWIDLFTDDAPRAHRFYADLFGWTFEVNEEFGGYTRFSRDGVAVAGCMGNDQPGHPSNFWTVYLRVDDIAASVEAARSAGGSELLAPMPVGELGHMAMIGDPGGAATGLWQVGTFEGIGVLGEPNAPGWFELHTTGYDAVLPFYRDVFGWDLHTMSDTPEFRYSTLGEAEGQLAGISDDAVHSPADSPSYWAVYIAVADADATAARSVELGGAVAMQPEDTPYGRLAVLTDPTGSRFSIMGATTDA